MKKILNHLLQYKTLSQTEAKEMMLNIGRGNYPASQVSVMLAFYMMRSVTVDEIIGFREAMIELCKFVDLSDYDVIDIVGTGGDGKNTFNISTIASFVVGGAGVKVAKHGNHGVSSITGSATVLENLGVKFLDNEEKLKQSLDESNVCFLFAPYFHPALKNMAPIRREIGLRTIFNLLGPLVNPSQPHSQLLGVNTLEHLRLYQYIYQNSAKNFLILHTMDGYDEISLTDYCKIVTKNGEEVFHPNDFGMNLWTEKDLYGGDTKDDAAKIFMNILQREATKAQTEVVIINAAFAIQCITKKSLHDAIAIAKESLESKRAYQSFLKFKEINQ